MEKKTEVEEPQPSTSKTSECFIPEKTRAQPSTCSQKRHLLHESGVTTTAHKEILHPLVELLEQTSSKTEVKKMKVQPSTCSQKKQLVPEAGTLIEDVCQEVEDSFEQSSFEARESSSKKAKRHSFVKHLCTKTKDLTPNVKLLLKEARHFRKMACRSANRRLLIAKKILKRGAALTGVNALTWQSILLQLRMQSRKPLGGRFTLDDKILALSLFNREGYKTLSELLALPPRKTLISLLNKIPFGPGVNKHIFNHLKSAVSRLKPCDRYCTLMFDEISLGCRLQYNRKLDGVEGFVDYGNSHRLPQLADHALVFMLRGIRREWKQPVCFAFCEGTTPTDHLLRILKDVIRQVMSSGLKIVATVCDQGATNRAVVNALLQETEESCLMQNIENSYYGFLFDGVEIIPLYDFPCLLKGIRNNLLTKDLHFSVDKVNKVASWKHVVQVFEADMDSEFRMCWKLTEEHVMPGKLKKMSVHKCSQVFSHQVAACMEMLANLSGKARSSSISIGVAVDPEAADTAKLLAFFDKLFDSVNGSAVDADTGKPLRCAVTSKSPHHEFWNSAIPFLESMYFTRQNSNTKLYPSSLKNWIFSIRGLREIWKNLERGGFKFLSPRNLNKDPLEKFFGCIRSHTGRNVHPTCSSFVTSSKSLLLNNFTSPHSVDFNCEADNSEGALDTLKSFLKGGEQAPPMRDIQRAVYLLPVIEKDVCSITEEYSFAYVAGFVAKRIIKSSSCLQCRQLMTTCDEKLVHAPVVARQYTVKSLLLPGVRFMKAFEQVFCHIVGELPHVLIQFGIKSKLKAGIQNTFSGKISALFCEDHQNLVDTFLNIILNTTLFTYINNVNKTLMAKNR